MSQSSLHRKSPDGDPESLSNDLEQARSSNPENMRAPELEKYLALIATLKGHEEFSLDSNGIIISSNLEAVNITGYEEYEVIGKHISMFYPPEENWKALDDLRKASALSSIVVTGIRLKKRGTTFWAKMKIKHNPDGHSKIVFKVTIQDNTHRTLSKIQMQSVRDEFLTIFNNPFIGTFKYKREDYRILMCNQKILDITGYTNSGNLFFNSFFNSAPQWKQFNELLDRDKKVEGFQFIINDKRTPETNWGLVSARIFEKQGFVGGVVMDISEQYHQMTELQRLNTELENFTYHASHDLRAPLTTIMGLANLGAKENSIDGTRHYFEMIQQRIHHLDVLLKDLVSISYNTKVEIKSEPFDFKTEINSLIESLHGPYPSVNIKFDIEQPHVFLTDATRARTIFRNLFSNSLKYHNPENTPSYLKIKVRVGHTHASIKLQDNGIGIEHSYKNKIFEMFFRATTKSNGSGLGLYIAKAMLEKVNGKIAVESTVNKGTTFLLTIPNRGLASSDN